MRQHAGGQMPKRTSRVLSPPCVGAATNNRVLRCFVWVSLWLFRGLQWRSHRGTEATKSPSSLARPLAATQWADGSHGWQGVPTDAEAHISGIPQACPVVVHVGHVSGQWTGPNAIHTRRALPTTETNRAARLFGVRRQSPACAGRRRRFGFRASLVCEVTMAIFQNRISLLPQGFSASRHRIEKPRSSALLPTKARFVAHHVNVVARPTAS